MVAGHPKKAKNQNSREIPFLGHTHPGEKGINSHHSGRDDDAKQNQMPGAIGSEADPNPCKRRGSEEKHYGERNEDMEVSFSFHL
jgi:hypothetical protein